MPATLPIRFFGPCLGKPLSLQSNKDLEEGRVDERDSSGSAEAFVTREEIGGLHKEEERLMVAFEHGVVQRGEVLLSPCVEVKGGRSVLLVVLERE